MAAVLDTPRDSASAFNTPSTPIAPKFDMTGLAKNNGLVSKVRK